MSKFTLLARPVAALALAIGFTTDASAQAPLPAPQKFDAAAAEHLLNRAGFGASEHEVARFARLGLEVAVAELFEPVRLVDPFFVEFDQTYGAMRRASQADMDDAMNDEARSERLRRMRADFRRSDRQQMATYTEWWIQRMLAGDDPLRDRMTLFWSGLFTSSFQQVKSSSAMIAQHRILRDNALGSYADILRGIARDPAMLQYLDNASNKKREPNENFARELLELFTLGDGHYSEADIVAAARAFTGWTDRDGAFVFQRNQHDRGEKTFLGETGNFDGDDILRIILAQPRCSEYVAGRLLAYLEGRPAKPERVATYAAVLRTADYQVRPLLEKLFNDPAFYAADVVGQRIASPIDFLVGHARRLGVEPPGRMIALAAGNLGQMLFDPPSVKGWDGDRAWIDTTTIMQRGNLAGVLVGTVGAREFLEMALTDANMVGGEDDPEAGGMSGEMGGEMDGAMEGGAPRPMAPKSRAARRDDLVRMLDRMEELGWRPSINLSARLVRAKVTSDPEVVDALARELLGVALTERTRSELVAFLAEERGAKSLAVDVWTVNSAEAEPLARRLAHLMLSLPEAQLN